MKLTIPVCTWKTPKLLKNCIDSLIKSATVETQIIPIIQEKDPESIRICEDFDLDYINTPKNLGASFATDFTLPFIKHEYVAIINDDMIFSIGWDKKLIQTIEKNYPCTASAILVERNNQDPLYQKNVISDDLGEIDDTTFDKFNKKVSSGFYRRNDSYSRQHPLVLKTEDLFKVNGYTDGWDLNWYPGHCMDDYFPYRLLRMNQSYRFILNGDVPVYHGVSRTIKKLFSENKEALNYNPQNYFRYKTGMSTTDFRKMIGEFA